MIGEPVWRLKRMGINTVPSGADCLLSHRNLIGHFTGAAVVAVCYWTLLFSFQKGEEQPRSPITRRIMSWTNLILPSEQKNNLRWNKVADEQPRDHCYHPKTLRSGHFTLDVGVCRKEKTCQKGDASLGDSVLGVCRREGALSTAESSGSRASSGEDCWMWRQPESYWQRSQNAGAGLAERLPRAVTVYPQFSSVHRQVVQSCLVIHPSSVVEEMNERVFTFFSTITLLHLWKITIQSPGLRIY